MACTALYTVTPTPDNTVPGTIQNVPTGITNGATVNLSGGVVYSGTLVLTGLSNVTVRQVGTGNAVIRPALGGNAINASFASSCVIGNIASDGTNSIKIVSASRGIDFQGASGCSVTRVDFLSCSAEAIAMSGVNAMTIHRCFINNCSATGIGSGKAYNTTISENTIRNCRSNNSFQGMGVYIEEGSSNTIVSNLVTSCTYHGISYLKPVNGRINCNTVTHCPGGADADAGGIYSQFVTNTVFANCIISSNTVTNITNGGKAIYLDDLSTGVTVQRNVVRSCSEAILLHRGRQCTLISNSCTDISVRALNFAGGTSELFSNTCTNNVFRCEASGVRVVTMETGSDFRNWCFFNNNYYFTTPPAFGRDWLGTGPATDYDYASWKALLGGGNDVSSTYNVTVGAAFSVVDEAIPPDPGSAGPTSSSTGPVLARHRLRR